MIEQFLIGMDHPIVKHHRSRGQGLLPASSYIDLLFQLFREQGYDAAQLELCGLTVYLPLLIGNEEKAHLRIQLEKEGEHVWNIRGECEEHPHTASIGSCKERKLLMTARMLLKERAAFKERLDIARIRLDAEQSIHMEAYYDTCRMYDLVHDGIMLCEGTRFESVDSDCCLQVTLGSEALPNAAEFMFHPALIEGGIVGSGALIPQGTGNEEELFVPLHFESFRASRTLDNECWVRISEPIGNKPKLHLFTLEFFDSSGSKIAELLHFWSMSQKRE